jgi:hypothetical protein
VNDAFGTTSWLFQDISDVTFIVVHRVVRQRHLLHLFSPTATDNYCQLAFIKSSNFLIPGVGWSTSQRLEGMKVKTCGDLQAVSMSTLQQEFGPKTGASLYKFCRGQDERPIKTEKERKSVSAEVNYGIRFKEVIGTLYFQGGWGGDGNYRSYPTNQKCASLFFICMHVLAVDGMCCPRKIWIMSTVGYRLMCFYTIC